MDDDSLGAELALAMGETSTQSSDAPASTAEVSPPEVSATTAPGETPAVPVTTTPDESKQGPIPFAVHKTSLENARVKARAEYEAEVAAERQSYAWAKHPQFRDAVDRITRAVQSGNPMSLASEILDDLAQTPEGLQQVRAFLGQRFGGLRQRGAVPEPQGPPQMPEPDVIITDGNGNAVGRTYSDAALAQRDLVLKAQIQADLEQRYGPKFQTLDTLQQREDQAEADRIADAFGKTMMQELSALPGFQMDRHGKPMAEALMRIPIPKGAHPDVVKAHAYRVYTQVVLPELQAQTTRAVVTTQQQKAAVGTASPQTGATGTPKTYADMTWAEAFQHELASRR